MQKRSMPKTVKMLSLLGSELSYLEIWDLQKSLVDAIANKAHEETIIFCEHELTVTSGRRSKTDNLLHQNHPIYQIERGGDFTLHAPGQLVIYTVLRLNERFLGIRDYLRFCEDIIITYLKSLHLDAGRYGPTGVWIRDFGGNIKKIASLGIAVRRWVTYHGIALNILNDLKEFQVIRPCDFESSIMTSLKEQGIHLSLQEVEQSLIEIFRSKLSSRLELNSLAPDAELELFEAYQ